MRADDDIYRSIQEAFEHLGLLRRGAETAEHLDRDREGGQALGKGLIVLLGEDGGGHQDRDLLAVHHRLEGRAQGHFRLAIADIAANQAVHGLAGFHVILDRLDGHELVGGFLVGKSSLQLHLPGAVGREGVSLSQLAAPRTAAASPRRCRPPPFWSAS